MPRGTMDWLDSKSWISLLLAYIATLPEESKSPRVSELRKLMEVMGHDPSERSISHKVADIREAAAKLKAGEDISGEEVFKSVREDSGDSSGKPASRKRKARDDPVENRDVEDEDEEPKPLKKARKARKPRTARKAAPAPALPPAPKITRKIKLTVTSRSTDAEEKAQKDDNPPEEGEGEQQG